MGCRYCTVCKMDKVGWFFKKKCKFSKHSIDPSVLRPETNSPRRGSCGDVVIGRMMESKNPNRLMPQQILSSQDMKGGE